jgi:hypothetical protein
MTQIIVDWLVFFSLSRCSPSSQGTSLCRSSLDRSFGVYLRAVFAYVLIFRRCFYLKDLRWRSRPTTSLPLGFSFSDAGSYAPTPERHARRWIWGTRSRRRIPEARSAVRWERLRHRIPRARTRRRPHEVRTTAMWQRPRWRIPWGSSATTSPWGARGSDPLRCGRRWRGSGSGGATADLGGMWATTTSLRRSWRRGGSGWCNGSRDSCARGSTPGGVRLWFSLWLRFHLFVCLWYFYSYFTQTI